MKRFAKDFVDSERSLGVQKILYESTRVVCVLCMVFACVNSTATRNLFAVQSAGCRAIQRALRCCPNEPPPGALCMAPSNTSELCPIANSGTYCCNPLTLTNLHGVPPVILYKPCCRGAVLDLGAGCEQIGRTLSCCDTPVRGMATCSPPANNVTGACSNQALQSCYCCKVALSGSNSLVLVGTQCVPPVIFYTCPHKGCRSKKCRSRRFRNNS